jgi:hypothetical protein
MGHRLRPLALTSRGQNEEFRRSHGGNLGHRGERFLRRGSGRKCFCERRRVLFKPLADRNDIDALFRLGADDRDSQLPTIIGAASSMISTTAKPPATPGSMQRLSF